MCLHKYSKELNHLQTRKYKKKNNQWNRWIDNELKMRRYHQVQKITPRNKTQGKMQGSLCTSLTLN